MERWGFCEGGMISRDPREVEMNQMRAGQLSPSERREDTKSSRQGQK